MGVSNEQVMEEKNLLKLLQIHYVEIEDISNRHTAFLEDLDRRRQRGDRGDLHTTKGLHPDFIRLVNVLLYHVIVPMQ